MVEAPSVYSQSWLPLAGSTATMPLEDCKSATGVALALARSGTGLVQLATFGRSSFQRLRPVFTSTPERVALAVVFDQRHHRFPEHDGRRSHAEAVAGIGVIGGQSAHPEQVALEIEGRQIVAAPDREDAAIRAAGRARGHRSLRMRHGAAGRAELSLPKLRCRLLPQSKSGGAAPAAVRWSRSRRPCRRPRSGWKDHAPAARRSSRSAVSRESARRVRRRCCRAREIAANRPQSQSQCRPAGR